MSTETEQFEQEVRALGTGGAALAIRFPRARTLARPPGKDGEMTVPLDTVNDIRSTEAAGRPGFKIARALHLSRNTVAKYADIEDMSPAAKIPQGGPGRRSSKSESTPSPHLSPRGT